MKNISNIKSVKSISESIYQRIYNYSAKEPLETVTPEPINFLGIDDITTRKVHNYYTVIRNLETDKIITIISGRAKNNIRFYLATLPEEDRFNIKVVSMDVNESYGYSPLEAYQMQNLLVNTGYLSKHGQFKDLFYLNFESRV